MRLLRKIRWDMVLLGLIFIALWDVFVWSISR